MDDYRLVAARCLAAKKEAWREPAQIALVTRGLQGLAAESDDAVTQAEIKYLLKQLSGAWKVPPAK